MMAATIERNRNPTHQNYRHDGPNCNGRSAAARTFFVCISHGDFSRSVSVRSRSWLRPARCHFLGWVPSRIQLLLRGRVHQRLWSRGGLLVQSNMKGGGSLRRPPGRARQGVGGSPTLRGDLPDRAHPLGRRRGPDHDRQATAHRNGVRDPNDERGSALRSRRLCRAARGLACL